MTAAVARVVDAVLLDADDTVYDTRSAMHGAGAHAARALWPDGDPDRLATAGVRFRDDPEGHFSAYTRGEIEFDEMRRARVSELAAWLGGAANRETWDAFEAHYEPAFLAAMRPFEDVRPAVVALRATGVAVGILTNSSSEYTAAKLAAARLEDLFDLVCSRDTLGYGKPDERAFHEACRRLAATPERTLHVGDELANDPIGASDAGLRAAWLVRDGEPDARGLRLVQARDVPVVASLTEVVALATGESPGPSRRFGTDESGR